MHILVNILSECYVKYQKLKNNYDVLWLILWRQCERGRNKRQFTYRRPKWSKYYEGNSLQLQIKSYTRSIRLCLSYFICDNKHTVACFLNRNSRLTRQKWKQNAESDSDYRSFHQSAHYLMVRWKSCEEDTFPQAFDLTAMWDCVDWWDGRWFESESSFQMNLISLS